MRIRDVTRRFSDRTGRLSVPTPQSISIRDSYLKALKFSYLVEAELETRDSYDVPFRRQLWLWRRGFLSRADSIYDLDDGRYREYLTDYERFVRTPQINGEWTVALSNKLVFHWLMGRFDAHRMDVYGLVRDGHYVPIDTADTRHLSEPPTMTELANGGRSVESVAAASQTTAAAPRVREIIETEGRVVLKWIKGGGGENVYICSAVDDGYRVNGETKTTTEFDSLVEDLQEYLVCEFVEQSDFCASEYPETANTLRIITMYDETEGEAFMPVAIHRIGTDRSAPMDNFSQGGLSAEIDVATGEMVKAVQITRSHELRGRAAHPETGTQIEGVELPGWNTLRDRLLDIAEANRQLRYVGWDVVPTDEDGGFTIIEGNNYPGMKSLQVHRPMLANDRVREFYRRHGVLRR